MISNTRGRPKERTSVDHVPLGFQKAVSYVDTVVVLLGRRVPPPEFRRVLVGLMRPFGGRYVRKKVPTANGFFIFKLWLHQPTEAALRFLEDAEKRKQLKVVSVHIALDLIADSFQSGELLRHHLEGRLLPSTRAKRNRRSRYNDKITCAVTLKGDTTYYFEDIPAGTEIAMYSDRFSKTAYGRPCCHLEYRLRGARTLRASNLHELAQVCAMDHRAFWDAQLAFWRPPTVEAIARASNQSARSRTSESLGSENNVRNAHRIIRLATHTDQGYLNGYLLYFELRDDARKYNDRPIRMYQKVDHDWALPSSENSMWPRRSDSA